MSTGRYFGPHPPAGRGRQAPFRLRAGGLIHQMPAPLLRWTVCRRSTSRSRPEPPLRTDPPPSTAARVPADCEFAQDPARPQSPQQRREAPANPPAPRYGSALVTIQPVLPGDSGDAFDRHDSHQFELARCIEGRTRIPYDADPSASSILAGRMTAAPCPRCDLPHRRSRPGLGIERDHGLDQLFVEDLKETRRKPSCSTAPPVFPEKPNSSTTASKATSASSTTPSSPRRGGLRSPSGTTFRPGPLQQVGGHGQPIRQDGLGKVAELRSDANRRYFSR